MARASIQQFLAGLVLRRVPRVAVFALLLKQRYRLEALRHEVSEMRLIAERRGGAV